MYVKKFVWIFRTNICIAGLTMAIINEIDILEDQIKLFIKDFLHLGFEYGFCDSEADIEFSKSEIMSMDLKYSILLINTHSNDPIIKLAPWRIDGLTSRI